MVERPLGALLEQACRSYAERPAVVDGERTLTYAELIADVRRSGRALLGLGLRRGDRVALLMKDRPELLMLYYGALWAGLVVVPLNTRQRVEDHAYAVADSGARVLGHDAEMAPAAEAIVAETGVEHIVGADPAALVAGGHSLAKLVVEQDPGPGGPQVAPDDLYAIYYTGGTTGRPKGVLHTHRTFLSALVSLLLESSIDGPETFAHVAPLTHASGTFVLPVWLRGGCNVILGGFDPERLLTSIERDRVTATFMVPTMLYVLLDHPALADANTSSLRTVLYGAAPMGRERVRQALERFGPVLVQVYGQTEAPNQLTVLRKDDHEEALAADDPTILESCGRPVAITELRLVGDDGNDVGDGDPGEIVARGPHVMREYWNKPDETAETLADGWLHTGDVARADAHGRLYIVDRKKDIIISGGYNVYPKEVEVALFAHPAVKDACVIGVPDEKWGEAVKAIVVAEGVDPEALIAWVRERKGSVSAPKSVEIIDSLPLTALGKHDKKALREIYWGDRARAVN